MKKCESCSCECEDNSNFCPHCGVKLTDKFDGATCAVCGVRAQAQSGAVARSKGKRRINGKMQNSQ